MTNKLSASKVVGLNPVDSVSEHCHLVSTGFVLGMVGAYLSLIITERLLFRQ